MRSKNFIPKNCLFSKSGLHTELQVRQQKLSEIHKDKIVSSNNFRRNYVSSQLHKKWGHKINVELVAANVKVSVAGRMIAKRVIGKATFIVLQDSGGIIQLYVTINSIVLNQSYENSIKYLDLGDIIGARGRLFKTRTGELSIRCEEIRLLTKSLRPLPDKYHGLNNIETKYRQRYLDLLSNKRSIEIFKTRSLIISEIRSFMKQRGFIEVETPMLHSIPSGAIAQPFITYHNKLGSNMYLRIAPELYLKKLIVGGFDRIFEMNRNFRNESISPYHNPEFTMMEVYIAYADYYDMIKFIQSLLKTLVIRISGRSIIQYGNDDLDFKVPFIILSMKEAIRNYFPEITSKDIDNIDTVITIAKSCGILVHDDWSLEKLYMVLFEEIVSKKIIQPTFVVGYPIEVSPLARANNNNPKIADRFELFIAGKEIGNGFSELNDPYIQRVRFLQQIQEKKNNDRQDIHIDYDQDYIVALEHGMPPTAGVGIGIDRLVMLLTNTHNIRDVILFPTLRSK